MAPLDEYSELYDVDGNLISDDIGQGLTLLELEKFFIWSLFLHVLSQ